LNVDNIFKVFNQKTQGEDSNEFSLSVYHNLNKYKVILLNFYKNKDKFINSLNLEGESKVNVNLAGEYMFQCRVWPYIENVKSALEEHKFNIDTGIDKDIILLLNRSMKFYENYEEYEKCSILKEILEAFKKI